MVTPIAPVQGRSAASLASPPSVPRVTSASGLTRNTSGAEVASIPRFAPAANPTFREPAITRTSGSSSRARRWLPSCEALSTTTTSSVASPAAACTERRHRSRCSPAL
jgi:hypothetical protein